jgi:hypothetical protein
VFCIGFGVLYALTKLHINAYTIFWLMLSLLPQFFFPFSSSHTHVKNNYVEV